MGFALLNPSYQTKDGVRPSEKTQARRPAAGNGRFSFSALSPAKKIIGEIAMAPA
jgi:hypothetical protein